MQKNRLLSKLANADEEQGVDGTQNLSVHKALEGSSTRATKLFAAAVELRKQSRGFTILEVVLAMAVLALLAGSIYAISMAAVQATHETVEEQLTVRRLEGFLRVTRDAFLNLPVNGTVYLTPSNDNGILDLNFYKATGLFGLPSLGGGTLVLSARARNDGTRTFSILRLPPNVQGSDRDHFYDDEHWINLLPKVTKPHWSFFLNGNWTDEWPQGAGRPQLVRLQMEVVGLHDPVIAIFYVPPIGLTTIALPTDDDNSTSPAGGGGTNQSTPSNPMNPTAPPVSRSIFH